MSNQILTMKFSLFLFKNILLTLWLTIPTFGYAQEFYKWVDANGSTHYTTTPSPKGVKRLNKVSTYADQPSNAQKQASTSAHNTQLRAQSKAEDDAYRSVLEASSAVESAMREPKKDKFTAAERAEIEINVRKGMQDIRQEKKTNPNAGFFGTTSEEDLRAPFEAALIEKKKKLKNTKNAAH